MSAGTAGGTLLTSAAATATRTSADQKSYGDIGGLFIVDFTATPNNTETFTFTLDAKDPVSGKYVALTAFTALTSSALGATPTTQTYLYTIYPGSLETAATASHEPQALVLPPIYRVRGVHSASSSWTYSVSFQTWS